MAKAKLNKGKKAEPTETKTNGNAESNKKSPKKRKISEVGKSTEKVQPNKPVNEKKAAIPAEGNKAEQKKIRKNKQKKLADKNHKKRVNDLLEKLKSGGDEAEKVAKQLHAILALKEKRTNDLKISVDNVKKLYDFYISGEIPTKTKSTAGKPNNSEGPKIQKTNVKTEVEKAIVQTETKKVNQKNNKKPKIDEKSDDDYDVEENVIVDKVVKKVDDEEDSSEEHDESVENDEDEEDDDDDEEDDADASPASKPKYNEKVNVKENLQKDGIIQKGQSRYVLFVGNIPYDCSTDELKEHFNKHCSVKDVRIPLERVTNKPRGFAYVELSDETAYQKALSLHHSQFKNRMINVLYSQGGKKKGNQSKQKIKAKNFKLHALRQKGLLTSDVKKSRQKAARKAIRQKKHGNTSQNKGNE